MKTSRRMLAGVLVGLGGLAAAGVPGASGAVIRAVGVDLQDQTKRENLAKMMRQVNDVAFQDQRLEDVLTFIGEITTAEIEPLWLDDTNTTGLDKERLITLKAPSKVSALKLLEMVLEKAQDDASLIGGGNGWQMTDWGSIECGPKERLASHMRMEIYPIDDMLFEIPDYPEAPEIDLQSVLQSSQGGSGGQSPFQDNQDDEQDRRPKEERANDIADLIQQFVEPEQWLSGGGEATIRYFQGSLIVRAPDFVHRQIAGYPWWPASQTSAQVVNGRRYVSIGVDTGIATVDDLVNQPVTGVVGGGPGGGP